MSATASAQLNALDELYLHLDRPPDPCNVHFEVRAEGRIDPERLAGAIRSAAARHPMARARLAPWRGTDVRYRWEICEALDEVPLEVVQCGDDAALAGVRERLLSSSPSLDRAPPFGLALAHHQGGDSVILNLHHAAGDGMGAVRLMSSILRDYGREDDPPPPVDPLEVRDVGALAGASSLGDRVTRGRALFQNVARSTSPATRIAADGGNGKSGYGFELLRFDAEETRRVEQRRRDGATVNDVLLAALAVSVRRWNERHDAGTGRITLTMPVNLRPAAWRSELLANFASLTTVHLGGDEHGDLPAAIEATASRTRRIKEGGIGGLMVDLLAWPGALPNILKRQLPVLLRATRNVMVDTALLSNLGRLPALPRLDAAAGDVRCAWFSPPGRMPLGAAFGAATLNRELLVTLRYRHALFDASAGARFGRLYRDVLLG